MTVFLGRSEVSFEQVVFSVGSMSSDSVSKAKFRSVLLVLHQETGDLYVNFVGLYTYLSGHGVKLHFESRFLKRISTNYSPVIYPAKISGLRFDTFVESIIFGTSQRWWDDCIFPSFPGSKKTLQVSRSRVRMQLPRSPW